MATTRQDNEALLDRLLESAARCGKAVDALPDTRMGRHVAGQMVRCGTAAAPNYAEACAAESRNDFVHKISIALKELRESQVWLRLCVKSGFLPRSRLNPLTDECTRLMNILGKSILTARANDATNRSRRSRPKLRDALDISGTT